MRRIAIFALAASLAFAACGGDAQDPEPEPQETTTAEATDEPSPTPAVTEIDVEIREGEVVGGMKRVEVPLNNNIRLSVRSDVADEVHVHGYDERRDIPAGGAIIMTFEADVPGIFVVELEQRSLHIAELEVS